ncbi:UNVERIFIED_ORG: hypothetical protein L601_005700000090 [Gordonia westfalica J30]
MSDTKRTVEGAFDMMLNRTNDIIKSLVRFN